MMTRFSNIFITLLTLTIISLFATASETNSVDDLVQSKVVKLAGDMRFTEGPVWHKAGYLLFSDIPANKIMKWSPEDKQLSVWREDSGNSNGLTFDLQGRLIACEHGNRRVSRTEKDGSITVIADRYKGKRLNSPNDAVVRSDGMIFFTDPSYGVQSNQRELDFQGVYRVEPGEEPVLLVDDFDMPNGLAFSTDEKKLYIADSGRNGNEIRVYDVEADGTLKNGKQFASHGSDGMKVDQKDRLYTTTGEGIVVYLPNGKRLGAIKVPEHPANCAFGGEQNKTLYITARNGLYKVVLNIVGIKVWRQL